MGEPVDKNLWGELEPEEGRHNQYVLLFLYNSWTRVEDESESESEEEEEEEEEASETAVSTDGLQTPSGLETPSGMASVVSTVAGGLETPDFLELRKNATARPTKEAGEASGPRSLYQVLEEKQTSVRGLMGSDRAYDMRTASGAAVPVLGEERGNKVCTGYQHRSR
jgi:splicing factor 3B subunit 2